MAISVFPVFQAGNMESRACKQFWSLPLKIQDQSCSQPPDSIFPSWNKGKQEISEGRWRWAGGRRFICLPPFPYMGLRQFLLTGLCQIAPKAPPEKLPSLGCIIGGAPRMGAAPSLGAAPRMGAAKLPTYSFLFLTVYLSADTNPSPGPVI